jgi:hypothetical protein
LLLPKAIEGGLRFIGSAIARAGAPVERHVWSRNPTSLYRVNTRDERSSIPNSQGSSLTKYDEAPTIELARRCVIAVFGPAPAIDPVSPLPELTPGEFDDRVPIASDGKFEGELRSDLASYFDPQRTTVFVGALEVSPDRTAFRIVPQIIEIPGALRDRRLNRSRAVTVVLSMLPPGGTDEGAASVIRTFAFPNVSGPHGLSEARAQAMGTGWISLPALPEEVEARVTATAKRSTDFNALSEAITKNEATITQSGDAAERARAQQENARARAAQEELRVLIAGDRQYLAAVAPYTIRADLAETTPGNRFLQKLGALISGNAEAVADPIAAAIDPRRRAASAEEVAAAEDNLRIAAVTEATALVEARVEGNASTIRIAEIKATSACRRLRAAGYSDPACIIVP